MVITALDTSFNAVAVIEAYISFIWTDRYTDIGDFELYVPATAPYLKYLRNDFYISCTEADLPDYKRLMIIEKIEYFTNIEEGNKVLITGRSLESILQRRIIWKKDGSITEVTKQTIHAQIPSIGDATWAEDEHKNDPFPLQNGIQFLLDMNIMNPPDDTIRQIPVFTFKNSTDTRITSLNIKPCSYRGDVLYDVIKSICDMNEISFRILFDDSNFRQPIFVFELFKGNSHLSTQKENGYVCFSAEFDNLVSSDSSLDMSTYKTMAYFVGQGDKWSVKEYNRTETCYAGWIRVYNNTLYACKRDYDTHNVEIPRPEDKVPPNDPDNWALVTDWNKSIAYTLGSYVTYWSKYDVEIYRIDHDIVRYASGTTYEAGAVVMSGGGDDTWMYVSLQDDNNHGLNEGEWWYKCKDSSECFNAQDWEQVQSVQKETYEINGTVQDQSSKGMDRRELFVDATDVPSYYTYYDPGDTNEKTYILDRGVFEASLRDKALSDLTATYNRPTKFFDCEIETNTSFQYKKDYWIGDVVEVKDAYGTIDAVVVDSYIISHNETNEIKAYPTFQDVESSTITTRYLEVGDATSTGTFLVKVPEHTRFTQTQEIARSVHNGVTYYLISFCKKVTTNSSFTDGLTDKEMHVVAWTTDKNVYTDGRYQAPEDVLTTGPAIVGSPLFYIDIEGGITLPGVLNPSWLPPYDVNLGDITSVKETAEQYKNILLANL